ncbi:MAG: hypothetical protein ACK5X0_22055 [Rhodospirillales bacterium]
MSVSPACAQAPLLVSSSTRAADTQIASGRSARARRASSSAWSVSPRLIAAATSPRKAANSVSGKARIASRYLFASASSPASCAACAASRCTTGAAPSLPCADRAWRRASLASPDAIATSPRVTAS